MLQFSKNTALYVLTLLFVFFVTIPAISYAQEQVQAQIQEENEDNNAADNNPEMQEAQEEIVLDSLRGLPYLTIEDTLRYQRELNGAVDPVRPDTSLLFTSWEHALLREMKRQVVARPTRPGEAERSGQDPDQPREKGIRELSLGGIVFINKDDWTVWLNGQRVTPDAIPEQVLDMRVKNEYIEIKWYDGYTNLVYPLRLRPHQRFNLDNRIFLPGAAPQKSAL